MGVGRFDESLIWLRTFIALRNRHIPYGPALAFFHRSNVLRTTVTLQGGGVAWKLDNDDTGSWLSFLRFGFAASRKKAATVLSQSLRVRSYIPLVSLRIGYVGEHNPIAFWHL